MAHWETNFDRILSKLLAKKESEIFRFPVDWKGLNITDYPLIIKRPMDLKTVRDKFDKKMYPSYEEASADVRLIWSNSMLYNASGLCLKYSSYDVKYCVQYLKKLQGVKYTKLPNH